MVVEVLSALGRTDRIEAWLDGYRGPTRQLPRATARIDPRRWRDALGPDVTAVSWERANPRWADWVELFTTELTESLLAEHAIAARPVYLAAAEAAVSPT
jgi:hypothetical protein